MQTTIVPTSRQLELHAYMVRHYPGRARGRVAVPVEVLSGIESQRESQRERHGDVL